MDQEEEEEEEEQEEEEGGPWTRSREGVHRPLVHVLSLQLN